MPRCKDCFNMLTNLPLTGPYYLGPWSAQYGHKNKAIQNFLNKRIIYSPQNSAARRVWCRMKLHLNGQNEPKSWGARRVNWNSQELNPGHCEGYEG